jgi:hypothetical protein
VVINRQRIVQGRRDAKQALFETVQALYASGQTINRIVRETGISRKRVTAWTSLVELPERNQMEPTPRPPAFYQEHLAKRSAEGHQHGRSLLNEIQELGYTGCFSCLARFLARWRQKTPTTPVASETTMPGAKVAPLVAATNSLLLLCRQISPQVATAFLHELQPQMTTEQENTVDACKNSCPGYAVMRSLVMSFHTILRIGKIKILHAGMKG